MDLNYSQDELAFRDEVRAWLAAHLPADLDHLAFGTNAGTRFVVCDLRGTIFMGRATPIEGGAMGMIGAVVLAVLHRPEFSKRGRMS